MFGVPIRAEIGPREAEGKTVTLVRRDTREKNKVQLENLVEEVKTLAAAIQESISKRSWERFRSKLADAFTLDELKDHMDQRRIVRVNWCGDQFCALEIKDQVAGEVRGTLWERHEEPTGDCLVCRDGGKYIAYVSRTY